MSETKEIYQIAIDGPAASGKGSIACELSRRLDIPCLDTGAIYRGMAVREIEYGGVEYAGFLTAQISGDVTRITLAGVDITDRLREENISTMTAQVAQNPAVRKVCTDITREVGRRHSVIVDGRDIASVVFPDAKYKFYVTADIEARAKRRYDEVVARGENATYEQILSSMKTRDESDMTKGGLKQVPEAIVVDTTQMTVDQAVSYMLKFIS